VNALLKHHSNKSESGKKSLIETPDTISLIVALTKIPEKGKVGGIPIALPNSLFDADENEMCMFVKEDAKDKVRTSLTEHPVEGLTKVIGLGKLRTNYKRYEERRKLCSEFDLFLCDDRIIPMMPKALGKSFFEKKKHPVPVRLRGNDISNAINKARDSTQLYLGFGPCSAVRIAKTTFSAEEIVENIMAGMAGIIEKVPKKWKGVHAIHIKTHDSIALPIFNYSAPAPITIKAAPVMAEIKAAPKAEKAATKAKAEKAAAPAKKAAPGAGNKRKAEPAAAKAAVKKVKAKK
jgi:ribosome biogenesis protein UTP30